MKISLMTLLQNVPVVLFKNTYHSRLWPNFYWIASINYSENRLIKHICIYTKTPLLQGFIKGPEGTPYAGGTFEIKVDIPEHYPFEPPKVTEIIFHIRAFEYIQAKFVTRIWHPNISSQTGTICLDILKDKWLVFTCF